MKACTRCKREKPLDAFAPNRHTRDGRQSWCRECYAEHRRAKYAADAAFRASNVAYGRAYKRAVARLRELHRAEFDRLLGEELDA